MGLNKTFFIFFGTEHILRQINVSAKKKMNEKFMKIERFGNENGDYFEKRVFFVLSGSIIEKWDFNFQKDFGGC